MAAVVAVGLVVAILVEEATTVSAMAPVGEAIRHLLHRDHLIRLMVAEVTVEIIAAMRVRVAPALAAAVGALSVTRLLTRSSVDLFPRLLSSERGRTRCFKTSMPRPVVRTMRLSSGL